MLQALNLLYKGLYPGSNAYTILEPSSSYTGHGKELPNSVALKCTCSTAVYHTAIWPCSDAIIVE